MLDFAECEQLVSRARDRRSKPIAHNTRVERRDENTYALRLHATDIATFHRDGRVTINSGGWRTVTTKDRLRGYVTHHIGSERGVWYVDAEPDPNDPRPARGERKIPKPFEALDPGPEPVKPTERCLAGTQRVTRELRRLWVKEEDRRDDDVTLEHSDGYFTGGHVEREVVVGTHYYEHQHETYGYGSSRRDDIEGTEETKHEQCPHCKLFEQQHRAWSEAMNGGGWGRNRTHGYAKMVELLERFGSREAWREAYLADFRAAREARKLYKEWVERNRVPFEDGMEITAEGYAARPNPRAIAKAKRQQKHVDKKRERINRFVADAVRELVEVGVPMPSGGDCWGCCFRAEDRSIEPMGVDHLEDHIRERYYVPSMFVNALREAGYRDTGIYMFLAMNQDTNRMGGPQEGFRGAEEAPVTRALRRYLYKRLIPEAYGENKIPPMVGNPR